MPTSLARFLTDRIIVVARQIWSASINGELVPSDYRLQIDKIALAKGECSSK
jgi:hypothetical protein